MAAVRHRLVVFLPLAFAAACASAGDRLNEGIELQAQGRYMAAAYRYAEAVERDAELLEARERLVTAGDTAIMVAMDDADELELRGDPVEAAGLYRDIDDLMARVRQVGMRLEVPSDYSAIRRAMFDNAITWQMARGDEAAQEGRWSAARRYYIGARGDYLPSRTQVEESYEAETRVLLDWSAIELTDERPRAAYALAIEALEVRSSPARDIVLQVRDLQERALEMGTVVVAILPVIAQPGVREYLGAEFEIDLDEDLSLDHWNRPPLFVTVADPIILRRELRGLLRGQIPRSPALVGRALDLIGADLGVLIELSAIEVVEEDVDSDTHEAVIARNANPGLGRGRGQGRGRGLGRAQAEQQMDTVTYTTLDGVLSYFLEAEVIIVDANGREVERFNASSRQSGPFERGEFDGDPARLDLDEDEERFFDPRVLAAQVGRIEGALLEDLAVAIAVGTFDTLLSGVR